MIMNLKSRYFQTGMLIGGLILAGLFATSLPGWRVEVAAERKIDPIAELWRLAPPAPKIAESDYLAELRTRRQEVMKRMGNQSLMVLFSTEPRVYTGDVDYHYRQENNLYYL